MHLRTRIGQSAISAKTTRIEVIWFRSDLKDSLLILEPWQHLCSSPEPPQEGISAITSICTSALSTKKKAPLLLASDDAA